MARVFCLAYQFPNEETTKTVWQKIHDVLQNASDVSVSCYNIQLLSNQQWYVAIVGKTPPASRQKQFVKLCEGGIPIRLSESEIVKLTQQRLQGVQEGNWVVKHHKRPGKYI